MMIKISKKSFAVFALFLVIILFIVIIYTKGGHSYEVDLFKTEKGWGYDILKNNKTYIHQPFMPAIEGQVPFKDKKSARKTGRLVVRKIRNRESPAITKEELESVLKD